MYRGRENLPERRGKKGSQRNNNPVVLAVNKCKFPEGKNDILLGNN